MLADHLYRGLQAAKLFTGTTRGDRSARIQIGPSDDGGVMIYATDLLMVCEIVVPAGDSEAGDLEAFTIYVADLPKVFTAIKPVNSAQASFLQVTIDTASTADGNRASFTASDTRSPEVIVETAAPLNPSSTEFVEKAFAYGPAPLDAPTFYAPQPMERAAAAVRKLGPGSGTLSVRFGSTDQKRPIMLLANICSPHQVSFRAAIMPLRPYSEYL